MAAAPLINLEVVLQDLWRGRWVAVGVASALTLLFAIGILSVRDRFEASARIYIDTQSVLKPLMVGLTVQPDIDQQVKMLARTLISRPNVERLRASPEIGWDSNAKGDISRQVDSLMTKIKVAPSGDKNIYAITYRDTDPDRAARLVESLVQTFIHSSDADKRKDSAEARRFIDEQIRAHETKLTEAENARKDFKLKNFGVTGAPAQDFFMRMSALTEEVNKLRLELSAAEQTREALKRELAQEDPSLPAESSAQTPGAMSETDSRLDVLKKQLDEMLRRYTEEHPDVVSTRRTIAQIEQQKRQEAEARAKQAAATGRAVAATNPVYQKIRFALAEAEAEVASAKVRLGAQQARLNEVRALASRAPQIEAEWSQLERDYDIIRKNYDLLVARRETASMGVKIDESSPLVEFRIVDPPRAAPRPVFPSRVILGLMGAVVALCAGLVAAFAYSKLRPVVGSVNVLRELSGRPVLGSVAIKLDPRAVRGEQVDRRAWLAALSGLLLFQAFWVGWALRHSVM